MVIWKYPKVGSQPGIWNLPQIICQVDIHRFVSQGFHCGLYGTRKFSPGGNHAPSEPQLSFLFLPAGCFPEPSSPCIAVIIISNGAESFRALNHHAQNPNHLTTPAVLLVVYEAFSNIFSLITTAILWKEYYYPYFIGKEINAQNGEVSCSSQSNRLITDQDSNPRHLMSVPVFSSLPHS